MTFSFCPFQLTAILSSQPVDRIVGFARGANEAAEGIGDKGTCHAASVVNIANVDLDGSVVLGGDEAVGGGAG